jgi:hypothetical protein
MKLKQLSLFLQNEPGALTVPCRALAAAGVNIMTFSLADTQQYGILRIIVREWEKAKAVLEDSGCLVKVTDVVAVEVLNQPGGLLAVLEVLEQSRINVEYVYAFTIKRGDKGVLVFRFGDTEAAIKTLQAGAIHVLDDTELTDRLQG